MHPPTKVLSEFKSFALKGNMIDLAVAVVIGGAFGKVVESLVKNVLMPILSYVTPQNQSYRSWHIGRVELGAFLSELINFLVIAGAMFLVIVKLTGWIEKATGLARAEEPTMKECPYCLSSIPARATRCAHCTSELNAPG
jgi:large conductance mechanosensitive channel